MVPLWVGMTIEELSDVTMVLGQCYRNLNGCWRGGTTQLAVWNLKTQVGCSQLLISKSSFMLGF